MGAKGEALARQFEAKAQEAGAYIEKLGDADLKRVTEAERWTVAATAHHLFGAYDRVPDIAKGLAAGQSPANFSTKVLDQMNAQHAKDFAACGKADVMALHRAASAKAASVIRGLSDEEKSVHALGLAATPQERWDLLEARMRSFGYWKPLKRKKSRI